MVFVTETKSIGITKAFEPKTTTTTTTTNQKQNTLKPLYHYNWGGGGGGSSVGRARDFRCGRPLPTGWVGVSIM